MSKVETLKSTLAIPAMIAAAFALAACAGAPCPATDANPAETPNTTSVDVAKSDAKAHVTETAENSTATAADKPAANADSENSALFVSNALDSYRLATPESKFADNANDIANSKATATATQITDTSAKASTVADPYTAFPALAEAVFAHADSLYKAGQNEDATAYLERFRVIKPLWEGWAARADSMLLEFGKARATQTKKFESMILEIQNMNRVKAAYSMVAETADSLIAQAPGDSLTNWATAQKQIAYKNTLSKAQKDYASIKALADDQAKFAEAQKQAAEFQMRYRDFEDTLHIQALIDHIRDMAESADPAAIKYWEKNDPAKALAQADALIAADKFKEARELLNKLKASKLRKEANDRLQMLGDAYCNKQRKETSQIFAKAQKQKDEAKKRELLKQAIAPLDKCLSEYPNNSQRKKVQENKEFLEKELAK